MKYFFLLLALISLGSFDKVYAASNASASSKSSSKDPGPSVPFPVTYMRKLAGVTLAAKAKGRLDCSLLLNKTWPYPNALVTPFCYNAETSCAALHLFKTSQQKATENDLKTMNQLSPYVDANVVMNLYACAEALQATLTNNTKALPPMGSYAPFPSSITGQ